MNKWFFPVYTKILIHRDLHVYQTWAHDLFNKLHIFTNMDNFVLYLGVMTFQILNTWTLVLQSIKLSQSLL